MAAEKDVVALIVECENLTALEVGCHGEQGAEEVRGQQAERRGEVVEDEFGDVLCGAAMAGDGLAGVPVGDGEVKGGADGEVDDGHA